jgi:mono/diheme cytochrome c family protein
MLASVQVLEPEEFDAWLEDRRTQQDAGSVELGREEWEGVCAKCHGLAGQGGLGPRIAGSPTLSDRDALEQVVRNGIRTMPAVGSGWSDEQVAALARYLQESPPSGS